MLATLGWGVYLPWSVPALSSGVAAPDSAQLGPESYVVLFLAGLIGTPGTLAGWRFADQT